MSLHNLAAAALAAAAAAMPAHALLVTDAGAIGSPPLVVDFDAFDGLLTSGPVTVAPGVTFTADSGAELGAQARTLHDNGVWTVVGNASRAGSFVASGVAGELRFSFDAGLTSAAGAFVNHAAFDLLVSAYGAAPLAVEVSAYGQNHQIIETHRFVIDTAGDGYDEGQFLGISRAQADIRAIAFKGHGVVLDNLTLAPVPEPQALALLLAGLGVLAFQANRRRPR